MTSQTAQTDFDLEVPPSEVQPSRIPMNPKLLKLATSGDKRIIDELLRQGDFSFGASMREITITVQEDAPTEEDTSYLFGVTQDGNTVLHIVASRGHLDIAQEICRREIHLLAAPNTRLDTPLHCAAKVGDVEMVSFIIQFAKEGEIEERKVLRATNIDKANALHEAAKYNHVSVAKVLMDEDAGLASMLNDAGMSPLYQAIVTGSLDVAKALLRSSSWENASLASYAGPNKITALHVAALLSSEITEDILQRKPMLAKGVDSSGRIPLYHAALYDHHDTVKLLLEHDPSTAYVSCDSGSFPIHGAARRGNISVVDQILKQCPDTDVLLDRRGRNFLHVAFQWRKLDVVKEIISKRPDLRKLINNQDNEGNTPLHTAVINSDLQSVHFLLRDKTVSNNVMNHSGFTPLDLACAKLYERGLLCRMNADDCIANCLVLTKSLLGLGDLSSHQANQKRCVVAEDHIENELNLSRNMAIASVLIATVTFAAGFTVPGGYIQDDHPGRGTAVLAKEYAFKVFLVSDASALVFSIVATCCLTYAGTSIVDTNTRRRALWWAVHCLCVAFTGMSTAFAMGIYVVLPPSCHRISILLCIIALGAPLLAHMLANYSLLCLLKTVRIRQGYRQCIWPTRHPQESKLNKLPGFDLVHFGIIIASLLPIPAIFFLLAML